MYIKNQSFILQENSSILEVVSNLSKTGYLICCIVDKSNKLLGSITDGDIRRGLLAGKTMEDSALDIITSNPVTSFIDFSENHNIELCKKHNINQIPIVASQNIIQALYLRREYAYVEKKPNTILIMAGGFGKRMMPLTEDLPKPMLEISGKPILEHIICNARSQGFSSFCISVHYLPDKIKNYFLDGSKWGVNITYVEESKPLGTAGCLTLFEEKPQLPFIVINGDLYSEINYRSILSFHNSNNADATMCVKLQAFQNPFGVISMDGIEIQNVEEKPIQSSYINSGIYVIEPSQLSYLEKNQYTQMTDFFMLLKNKSRKIVAFPLHEGWQDLGNPTDLKKMNSDSQV